MTPVLLREPMAPHIAAASRGAEHHARTRYARPSSGSRRAPTSSSSRASAASWSRSATIWDTGDLARELALPVVLVVGMRLGCLNHALLTARAIAAAGLPLAGWIANTIDPLMAVPEENVEALRVRLGAPLLGRLPFSINPDPRFLAASLDVSALLP